jgi:hypothetical protein
MSVLNAILRAEWLAVFITGVAGYLAMGGHPLWLLPGLLAPDLTIAGYLGGPRVGAVVYNSVHNLMVALALLVVGWFAPVAWMALAGAILVAHVGMDRSLGFGLKLPTDFRDTHLGRIGRDKA